MCGVQPARSSGPFRAAVAAVALGLIFATAAYTACVPADVTSNPTVQRYLALAQTYFHVVDPNATSYCPGGATVVETKMQPVVLAGQRIAGSAVWAEARPQGCEIDVSPTFYAFLQHGLPKMQVFVPEPAAVCEQVSGVKTSSCMVGHDAAGRWAQAYACATLAHEYGHTLGLADSDDGGTAVGANTLPIMASSANYDDPLCNLSAYGWSHLSHGDRLWLIGAQLAPAG